MRIQKSHAGREVKLDQSISMISLCIVFPAQVSGDGELVQQSQQPHSRMMQADLPVEFSRRLNSQEGKFTR